MTKGGVMIGRIGERAQQRLHRQARAQRHQCEGEAEQRGEQADQSGLRDRVPGHAATVCAGEAAETPDRWAQQFRQELAGCKRAIVVAHRGGENAQHRVEHEQCDQADDKQQRAGDEHVALAGTESGEAVGKEHEAGERVDRGAPAHGRLTGAVAEQSGEPGVSPAAVDDEQAFAGQPCESRGAGGDKKSRRLACEPGPGGKQQWQRSGSSHALRRRTALGATCRCPVRTMG